MKVLTLHEFALMLIKRNEQKFDDVLITESGSVKGTGKSTFSMLLDREICQIMGFEFDIRKIIVFDPTNEKIVDQVRLMPFSYPVHIDEGTKVAYKRNWANEEQKRLVIFVNVSRKHYKIINVNNPSFWSLDKDLLDLADFRITILKRGIAIVRGKVKNPETDDKWLRKDTDEHIRSHSKESMMNIDSMINAIRSAPNYLFEIHFPDMDQKVYAEYEEISREAEMQSFYETQTNLYRHVVPALLGILELIIKKNGLKITSTDITREINWYIKERNMPTTIQPDRVRSMLLEAHGLGQHARVEEILGQKCLVKGLICPQTVILPDSSVVENGLDNKNNNTTSPSEENGPAGAGGLD